MSGRRAREQTAKRARWAESAARGGPSRWGIIRGRNRAARRRQRGRERALATRWLRWQHRMAPWFRRPRNAISSARAVGLWREWTGGGR